MSKRVLITGGAGFIGSNLASQLLGMGYEITILDNLSEQIHGEVSSLNSELKGKVKFIHGDVRSKKDWLKAIEGVDVIIHLAAETGTGQSMYRVQKYADVNISGTAIMLDQLVNEKHSVKKVIVASSRAIYGEGKYKCDSHGVVYPTSRSEEDLKKGDFEPKCPVCNSDVIVLPTDELSKEKPTSVYGITKQSQEKLVMQTCESINLPAVAFRFQNVYGPGQSLKNPYTGILSIFSTQIRNGNNINVFEDGKESRDFVFIKDAVDAIVKGIQKEEADFEVFNVGSGVQTTVLEVASKLRSIFDSDIDLNITGNFRLGDIRHNVADLTKIKNRLNFEPEYNFDEGVNLFIKWVKAQDVNKDDYATSIKEMKKKGLFK